MENQILNSAKLLQKELVELRHDLHRHPEIGFDLPYTFQKVKEELEHIGLTPKKVGKSGFVVEIGNPSSGKTILLRADMDALPLTEETDLDYASETPGKMHACGHDMHTTMLLGAAKLLKENESQLKGTVKLAFQPAEEIFQGSLDMIEHGLLESPDVDVALMVHVTAGSPIPSGMFLIPTGGISMPSCEQYHITVTGKGGHGSTPHLAIDPITAAAQIHLALQEINSRELAPSEYGVFSTCRFSAGKTSNVIPNTAEMWGTIRTTDPSGQIGSKIKNRMTEIATGIGAAFRCQVSVDFSDYCPSMVINEEFSSATQAYMSELFPQEIIPISEVGGGSEDFAFVSLKVPTVGMFLSAGNSLDGYEYSLHNPKTRFDDSILWKGAAAYAHVAKRWLES